MTPVALDCLTRTAPHRRGEGGGQRRSLVFAAVPGRSGRRADMSSSPLLPSPLRSAALVHAPFACFCPVLNVARVLFLDRVSSPPPTPAVVCRRARTSCLRSRPRKASLSLHPISNRTSCGRGSCRRPLPAAIICCIIWDQDTSAVRARRAHRPSPSSQLRIQGCIFAFIVPFAHATVMMSDVQRHPN